MLDDIDLLARNYLKCADSYEDGLLGNPFPILPTPYGKDYIDYANGLIAGNNYPDFMSDSLIIHNMSVHGDTIKRYKYIKYILKHYTADFIRKGFFSYIEKMKDKTIDKFLSVAITSLKKNPDKYDDRLIYKLMEHTGINYTRLLKFDKIEGNWYSSLIEQHERTFKKRLLKVLDPIVKRRQINPGVNDILGDMMINIFDGDKGYDCELLYKIINYIRKYGDMTILNKLANRIYCETEQQNSTPPGMPIIPDMRGISISTLLFPGLSKK